MMVGYRPQLSAATNSLAMGAHAGIPLSQPSAVEADAGEDIMRTLNVTELNDVSGGTFGCLSRWISYKRNDCKPAPKCDPKPEPKCDPKPKKRGC